MVRFLGLVRWPFLMPYVADTYTDPASTESTRQAVSVVFERFNRSGVAIGEHLGYLFTGLWTALVAVAVLRSAMFGRAGRWLGALGLISAAGILAGTLEFASLAGAADVVAVAVAYIVWSVWLFAFGVALLRTIPGARGGSLPAFDAAGEARS